MTAIHHAKPDGNPADVAAPRRRSDESSIEISAAAFESLLHAAGAFAKATTLAQTRTAPSQMFEPAIVDPRERRVAELKNDAGSTRASPVDRRGATEPEGQPTPSFAPASTKGPVASPPGEAKPVPTLHVAQQPATRPEQPNAPIHHQATHARQTAAKPAARVGSAPSPSPPDVAPPVTAFTSNPPSSGVAHQVGELLAAPRAGTSGEAKAAVNTPPSTIAPPQARSATTRATTTESRPSPAPTRPESTEQAGETPFARLVRSIRLHVGERTSSARLQLHPPELGRMRVDVRLDGDRLHLDVRTETQAARELVADRVGELKAALEQYGILVSRFDVAVQDPAIVGRMKPATGSADSPGSSRRRERDEAPAGADAKWLWNTAQLDVRA